MPFLAKPGMFFSEKMPVAAAKATAAWQAPAGEAPAGIHFRRPFANAKGGAKAGVPR